MAQKLRSLFGSAWDYALDAGKLDGDVTNWCLPTSTDLREFTQAWLPWTAK
jgi:hypothetical protein